MLRHIQFCVALSSLAVLSAPVCGETFQTGYTIGSGLLGPDLIFDGATHDGSSGPNLRADDGVFTWVTVWDELWDVGQEVSITGLALPVRSPNTNDTTNNTSNGTFTFTFYELSGGANVDAWDGVTNGEVSLTTRDVVFESEGAGPSTVPYVTFDSPITFNAASTGIAINLTSTSSLRTRPDDSPDGADGRQHSLGNGSLSGAPTGYGHQWTLAGSPEWTPPPVVTPVHRFDASQDAPGDFTWDPVMESQELFTFNAPGDYNGDKVRDAADYTVWRDNLGGDAAAAFPNGTRDPSNTGVVNAADYDYWTSNYGAGAPAPVNVNAAAVPGITKAYDAPARGVGEVFSSQIDGLQASRQDGSFEIWFKPDSLTGGEQVIYEAGGGSAGFYFSLEDDELSFFVKSSFDGNDQTLTTTLTDAEWTQVVGVIHNTYDEVGPSSDDYLELYINGVLVDDNSTSMTDINDWAGNNLSGLGQVAGSIATGGPLGDLTLDSERVFDGQIAIMEYGPGAWTASEVLGRYNAITNPVPASALAAPEPATATAVGLLFLLLLAFGRIRPGQTGLCPLTVRNHSKPAAGVPYAGRCASAMGDLY